MKKNELNEKKAEKKAKQKAEKNERKKAIDDMKWPTPSELDI